MADKATAQALLKQGRRRLVGALMGYLEQHVYPTISPVERERLRTKVLTAIDAYHDLSLDLVGIYADDQDKYEINEEALELLRQIHEATRE